MNMKVEKHTKIFNGSLKTELHPVPSHTKMNFTISKESFTKIAQEQLLNLTRTIITHWKTLFQPSLYFKKPYLRSTLTQC